MGRFYSVIGSSHQPTPSRQREFTLLLFPLLSRKLKRTISSLLPHPPLLAHTIYQALAFDAAIVTDGFRLEKTSAGSVGSQENQWKGVSEVILGNAEWFEAWLSGEKKCKLIGSGTIIQL